MEYGFLIACAFIVIVNLCIFTYRGFGKGLVRLITLAVAVGASYLLSRMVMPFLLLSAIRSIEKLLISSVPDSEAILSNPMVEEAFSKLVQMILLPALFCVIYSILGSISTLLYRWGCRMLPQRLNDDGKPVVNHWGGLLMGCGVAFLTLMVYIMPLYGYVDVATTAITTLEEHASETMDTTKLDEINETYLLPITETPLVTPLYEKLGAPVFASLSTVEWNDEPTNLRNETYAISAIAGDVQRLSAKAPDAYEEPEALAIEDIAASIDHSPMLRAILAELLSGAAHAWQSGGDFAGLPRPDAGENGNDILDAFLEVFSTTTPANIGVDFNTFSGVLSLAVKHDLMQMMTGSQSEDFANVIASTGFLAEAKLVLAQNPRMAPVTRAITDVGMRLLIGELGAPDAYKSTYGELMNEMSTVLQQTKVKEDGMLDADDLAHHLEDVMADHGVDVDEAAVTLIAHGLADHFTADELANMTTDEIVDQLIAQFGAVEMP